MRRNRRRSLLSLGLALAATPAFVFVWLRGASGWIVVLWVLAVIQIGSGVIVAFRQPLDGSQPIGLSRNGGRFQSSLGDRCGSRPYADGLESLALCLRLSRCALDWFDAVLRRTSSPPHTSKELANNCPPNNGPSAETKMNPNVVQRRPTSSNVV